MKEALTHPLHVQTSGVTSETELWLQREKKSKLIISVNIWDASVIMQKIKDWGK